MQSRMTRDFTDSAFEYTLPDASSGAERDAPGQGGVARLWQALALEGRARALWNGRWASPDRLAGAFSGLAGPSWAGEPQAIGAASVAAWSLPDNPRMRGLGLGRIWVVACPYCRRFHMHAPEEGARLAHCRGSVVSPRGYALLYAGEMPRALWENFHMSAQAETPRLLRAPSRQAQSYYREAA